MKILKLIIITLRIVNNAKCSQQLLTHICHSNISGCTQQLSTPVPHDNKSKCSQKLLSPTYYRDESKCPQQLLTTMCCNDGSIYNVNNIHEIISNNNYNSQEKTNEGISNRIDHAKIINNDNYTQQLVNNNKISNITNNVKINNNNYLQYIVINRYGNKEAYNILNNSEYFSNSCIQHSVTLSIPMYGSGSVFNITKAITSRYKTFQVFDTQTELYNVKYTFNYYKKCMKM